MGANIKDQRPQHTDEHALDRQYKETLRKTEKESHEPSGTKMSYGRKFAQTEELYRAHMMERELEELARQDGMLADEERPETLEEEREAHEPGEGRMFVEQRAPRKQKARGAGPAIEEVVRGAPIGAVPPSTEPPPRGGFAELLGDAQRYFQMVRGGARDVITGTIRLVRLPLEAATMTAARMRLRRA